MRKAILVSGSTGVVIGFLLAFTWFQLARQTRRIKHAAHTPQPAVVFNQKVVEGVLSTLNLNDPTEVFKTVFSAMDDEVMVYPTENYYYFQLYTAGKTMWGNLRLDADDRDQGILHLGYFEYDENGQYQDREGREKAFSAQDGMLVKRLGPVAYAVSYAGKTVVFHLSDLSEEKPAKARLRPSEVFVGPIFDESGLKFFLLFNNTTDHFYYLLDEEGPVPETFISLAENVVLGRRTGFTFYQDVENNRKVLIGAHGYSVDRNDYYDGPFDQLPDNYVEHSHIAQYIEQAYPFTRGQVDKFGGYKSTPGSRVLIFPYAVYYRQEEVIHTVQSCRDSRLAADQFYICITPDPSQSSRGPVVQAAPQAVGETTFSGKVVSQGKRKKAQD